MHYEKFGDLLEVAAGTFYRYIKGEGVKDLLHNIHVSNGLAWNEKEKKFYFIDSCKFDVKEYDYDQKSGDICKLIFLNCILCVFLRMFFLLNYFSIIFCS